MSKPKDYKSIHLHIPVEFHTKLKVAVAIKQTNIRAYIMGLIEKDLKKMTTKTKEAIESAGVEA